MLRNLYLLLILLVHSPGVTAQQEVLSSAEQEAFTELQSDLRERLKRGDSTALFAVIDLLDDERLTLVSGMYNRDTVQVKKLAWNLLVGNTDIAGLAADRPMGKAETMAYFRNDPRRIKFVPILGRFTDELPGSLKVDYRLQPQRPVADREKMLADWKEKIAVAVSRKDYFTPVQVIPLIGELGTPAAFTYLEECAAGQHWGKGDSPRDKQIAEAITRGLAHHQTMESAQLILDLYKRLNGWGNTGFREPMAWATGVYIGDFRSDPDSLLGVYQHLLDSLPSILQLREFSFQLASDKKQEDFHSRSEYLEYLIVNSKWKSWLMFHALKELEAMGNNRVLVQLAGAPLRQYFIGRRIKFDALAWQERLTGLSVLVKDKDGRMMNDALDRANRLNALHYWARHYKEYVWSEAADRFVYQGDDVGQLDTLTVLLERLKGKDEAGALESANALIHYPPDTLAGRVKEHPRVFWIQANDVLPRGVNRWLPELSEVVHFCRGQGMGTVLSEEASALVRSIDLALDEQEQEKKLQELSGLLNRGNATALELFMQLHERRYPRAYKVVFRLLYEWNLEQWRDESLSVEEVRLFLFKSAIGKKLKMSRGTGIWGGFENIVQTFVPGSLRALRAVASVENNTRIQEEIAGILLRVEVAEKDHFSVAEYVDYSSRGANVPVPKVEVKLTSEGLSGLFGELGKGTPTERYRIINLIDHHRDTLMAPYLLAAAEDSTEMTKSITSYRLIKGGRRTETHSITLGDYMIAQLEELYGKRFQVGEDGSTEEVMDKTAVGPTRLHGKRATLPQWRVFLGF